MHCAATSPSARAASGLGCSCSYLAYNHLAVRASHHAHAFRQVDPPEVQPCKKSSSIHPSRAHLHGRFSRICPKAIVSPPKSSGSNGHGGSSGGAATASSSESAENGSSSSSELYESYRDYVPWDPMKERNRRARRMLFSFDDWKRHRSCNRYLYHVKTLTESGIFRGILVPVLWVTTFATVVALYNHCGVVGSLPSWLPALPPIAIEPIQLTSIALSLLLVFRTNASYSRWDEGRRSFGSVTTVSRDIARQAFAWFRPEDYESRARISRWLRALGRSVMVTLREEHHLGKELQGVLYPAEVEALLKAGHAPTFCLQVVTRIISRAGLPQELVIRMDENVSRLTDAVSACDRILNTPIPLSYTRHTARFLMAWLVCLPCSLWAYCGWLMVPIATLVAFVLLGIEEIGVYIEEPFSILPLEHLVRKLDRQVEAMMREGQALDGLLAGGTYRVV